MRVFRYRTGQGRCAANLHKRHMASSDKCQRGGVQTTSHIVESCPLTRFDGDLLWIHSADDCAVTWLHLADNCAVAWLHSADDCAVAWLHSADDCAVAWLHSADDCAVAWLQIVAVKAFAK